MKCLQIYLGERGGAKEFLEATRQIVNLSHEDLHYP